MNSHSRKNIVQWAFGFALIVLALLGLLKWQLDVRVIPAPEPSEAEFIELAKEFLVKEGIKVPDSRPLVGDKFPNMPIFVAFPPHFEPGERGGNILDVLFDPVTFKPFKAVGTGTLSRISPQK